VHKDIQMRTELYIQLMTRLDRLEQELKNHLLLSKQLEHKWMTYASHRETGIVYDTTILDQQVMDLRNEITQIKNEIEEDNE